MLIRRSRRWHTWCPTHLFPRLVFAVFVAASCRFAPSFFIRASGPKGKKRGRCVYLNCRCPWKNASLPGQHVARACICKMYTPTRHSCCWRAAEQQQTPTGKRRTAAPIAAWKSNRTIVRGHVLLVFHLSVISFPRRAPFFSRGGFTGKTIRYTIMRRSINCHS